MTMGGAEKKGTMTGMTLVIDTGVAGFFMEAEPDSRKNPQRLHILS